MTTLMAILLKVNILLLVFAAIYFLVLRRLTYYNLNRCFLLLGVGFSSLYPFVDFNGLIERTGVTKYEMAGIAPRMGERLVASNLVSWATLEYVFFFGLLLMLLRFTFLIISLYRIHKNSAPGTVANQSVRILQQDIAPFSFWQTVYINPDLHKKEEMATILAHEKVHIKQWHSLDIILAELMVIVHWFNPGVWLMKHAVKENLEFITDERVLNGGVDRKKYQYSLLEVGNMSNPAAIVNNFSFSAIRTRILMMNKKRSTFSALGRYLLIIPVIGVLLVMLTSTKVSHLAQLMPLVKSVEAPSMEKPEIQRAFTATAAKISNKPIKSSNSTAPSEVLFKSIPNDADLMDEPVIEPTEIPVKENYTVIIGHQGNLRAPVRHVYVGVPIPETNTPRKIEGKLLLQTVKGIKLD